MELDRLTDEQVYRLVNALGDDALDVLMVDSRIMHSEVYWRDRILRSDIKAKVAEVEGEGLAMPYTPALKLSVQ